MPFEFEFDEQAPIWGRGYLGYPKVEMPLLPFCFGPASEVARAFLSAETAELRQRFVAWVERDPRAQKLEGKQLIWGASAEVFSLEKLAGWYLWAVNELGKPSADTALETYLASEFIHVSLHQAVKGIAVANVVRLTQDYSLIPASNLPFGDFKARLNWRQELRGPFLGASAVITRQVERPKAVEPDQPRAPDVVWQEMDDLALLLNAVQEVTCIPVEASATVAPSVPYGPFGGAGMSWRLHGRFVDVNSRELGDVTEVEDLWTHFKRGADNRKARWRNALMRLAYAKAAIFTPDDAALELGIGLEMLLLEGENTDQLKLMFRLRGAWLAAGGSAEERVGVFNLLGKIYDWRCDVAHAGTLKKKNEHSFRQERERAFRLAEKIAREAIRAGEVKWERLILGA